MKKVFVFSFLMISIGSCKKDCERQAAIGLLIPAVQKIRESANRNWQQEKGLLQKMEIPFSQPLKPEFINFKTDTSILIACRMKIKGISGEKLLPYSYEEVNGTLSTLLFVIEKDKALLYYHNTSGSGKPEATESLSLVFSKIQ